MDLPAESVDRVVRDLVGADLGGDPRRTERLVRMVSKVASQPGLSLPDIMASEAELEGAYRFVNNPRVTMQALQAAHSSETARRARDARTVLSIHDTTPCHCPHADAAEVGYLNTGKPGFYAHYSLIVGAGSRLPLGVSYLEPVVRTKAPRKRNATTPKSKKISGAQTRQKANREFERWERGIRETEAGLDGCDVIHIADRESDSYDLMAQCIAGGRRFVFRVRIGERKAHLLSGETGGVTELASRTEGVLTREVAIATRKPRGAPSQAKAHPPRQARLATLLFSATSVEICRPRYLDRTFPARLALNVVRVWEPAPPDGDEPVEWLLYTTESIETPAQVATVVDLYRARWLIEECNKALKSGCLLEQREFETRKAMLVMLALSLPIACAILALRAAVREDPDRPATDVLTSQHIEILRQVGSRKLPEKPTAREGLLAVAALGGHQRSNGDPGWLVLQRGMRKLLDYEVGWRMATGAIGHL